MHSPHLLGMLGPMTPHRAVGGPCPPSLTGRRPLQTFLTPEPLLPAYDSRYSPPAAAGGRPCGGPSRCGPGRSRGDAAEAWPPPSRCPCRHGAGCCDAAVLTHVTIGQAFRGPVTLLQHFDGSAATLWAQQFPSARSHCFAKTLPARASPFPVSPPPEAS